MLQKVFQRQPKFGGTLICLIYSLVKSINKCYYFKITSRLWSYAPNKNIPSDKNHFEDFPSKKKKMLHYAFGHVFGLVILCFAMLLLTYSTPKIKNFGLYNSFPTFWAKKWILLFICHYSLLLFTVTIHLLLFILNFCLFKGGCPLYFKQVFCVLSSGLLS